MSAFAVNRFPGGLLEERRGTRVFLALAAGLLCVSQYLLQDPDTHWHIAVGRWIWDPLGALGRCVLPHLRGRRLDREGMAVAAHFPRPFAAAGWRGVAALTAIVIAASFALLFRWLRCRIHATAALVVTLLAFILAAGSLHARRRVRLPILILGPAASSRPPSGARRPGGSFH